LKKYNIKANDAILAEESHAPMCGLCILFRIFILMLARCSYDDITKNHKVTYVAGGAGQNAARAAAVRPAPTFYVMHTADWNAHSTYCPQNR
jgi:adenosine kinase